MTLLDDPEVRVIRFCVYFYLESTGVLRSIDKSTIHKTIRHERPLMRPVRQQEHSRIIAIGDIHGCSLALESIIEAIDPDESDAIITLGDYVDKGPDTPGVLDQLIALRRRCRLFPLLGNHDQVMMAAVFGQVEPRLWLEMDGDKTIEAYGAIRDIPPEHMDFLASCELCLESDKHIFMHACYEPRLPLKEQEIETLLWTGLRGYLPEPHYSGKRAIVGHTSQKNGKILDAGHIVCIDTHCCGGKWLTAMDINSGQVWQTDRDGNLRGEQQKLT
jgi:serine/threonine protein phosphatase 1